MDRKPPEMLAGTRGMAYIAATVLAVGAVVAAVVMATRELDPQPGMSDTGKVSGDVIARVGAESIPSAEFDTRLRELQDSVRFAGTLDPAQVSQRQFLRDLVAETLIQAEWIEQSALSRTISVSPPEVREWYRSLTRYADRADATGGNSSSFRAILRIGLSHPAARRSPGRVDVLRRKVGRAMGVRTSDAILRRIGPKMRAVTVCGRRVRVPECRNSGVQDELAEGLNYFPFVEMTT